MCPRPSFVSLFHSVVVFTLSIHLSLTCLAQQPKVLAPHKPIAPQVPRDQEPHEAGTLRSLTGGLWMIDANMKSSLYLRNNVEESAVTVTPILYLSNGARYELAPVKIEAEGTAVVSINDALSRNGIAPWATLSGYVEVQYIWAWDPVCATVVSVDPIHSVIFTYGLQPPSSAGAAQQAASASGPERNIIDGMWWKQEPTVTGFVALSNTTGAPLSADLQVSDAVNRAIGAYTITVSPHGTKMVDLSEVKTATNGAGGLQIKYAGPEHGLVVNGGLEDLATGYSAEMPLRPPLHAAEKSTSTDWAELGLRSGAADSMMAFPADTVFIPFSVVRNVSNEPVTVTPSLYWMAGAEARSAQGASFRLPAGETRTLDVRSLLLGAGLGNFNGGMNLILNVQGRPHSVLLASGSVDSKNTYVFQVLPRAVLESEAKTVSYWDTANGDDTMVTIWNPADEGQDYTFTLSFTGGHYMLPIHLGPRATRIFNISELIQNQTPDRDGNIIPGGVQEGSAKISGIHAENEAILVAADVGTYNVRKATCTYYCISCDGEVLTYLVISPFGVKKGATDQLNFEAKDNTGSVYYMNNNTSSWNSSNTSIGTVSAGLVKGVSPGGLTISAFAPTGIYNPSYCAYDPYCPDTQQVSSSGPGTVFNFVVNGHNFIFVGSDSHIVAANSYYAQNSSGGGPQPSGGTLTAKSSDSHDTFQITSGTIPLAKITTPDQSTTNLDRTLTFTYKVSSDSISQPIAVTARKFAYVTNNAPSNACTLGYGTDYTYTYTIFTHPDGAAVDQNGGISGTPVAESFSPAPPCGSHTGDGALNTSDQFNDHIAYCSTSKLTCSGTSTQTLSVGGFLVRTNTLNYSSTGASLTNNGPTQ